MVYIVGETVVITDTIELFSYDPPSAGPYTISYSVAIVGNPVSTLAVTAVSNEITVGLQNNLSAASHTATLTGTLSHSSSITATSTFTLDIITIAGNIADQTYRIDSTGAPKIISFSEPTASSGIYTFTESAVSYNTGTQVESLAPSWLTSINSATNLMTIQTSSTADEGSFDLAIKAVVNEKTSAWHYITWNAKLFSYTVQVNDY